MLRKYAVYILLHLLLLCNQSFGQQALQQSYFKLTTSNGLVVAVYNSQTSQIDYVYPHIFANYDSGKYVHPFAGNIKLHSQKKPTSTGYLKNTHVISCGYDNFNVYYLTSFTREDKIFYVVIRGEKNKIENLSVDAETETGQPVSGVTLLQNPLEDLPVHISGKILTGSFLRKYNKDTYEKYFLYSFTDSLHHDSNLVQRTVTELKDAKTSLIDDETAYMQSVFARCLFPKELSVKERNAAEQSVSILKMSQVSDKEIFANSHGQILASVRPGLWHISWVRDGSYAIMALTHLGLFEESKKFLEFMLKAPSGQYKSFTYKGKDYGVGSDYQISVTRYFGNGREETDFNNEGANIEFDDFGLFLTAYCDYVEFSRDSSFYLKWNDVVRYKVADATINCIDANSLIKEDSGPWEHHLQTPKQYTFTSGVCARGLELFSRLQKKYNLPFEEYSAAAERVKDGINKNMLIGGKYYKGNVNDTLLTDHEYYDAGAYEIFANGLITDKQLFHSHLNEYDKIMKIPGDRPGYIRLAGHDPYENQEWVFINLRIAFAYLLFNEKGNAAALLNHVTEQASLNFNTIPEMYSNEEQMKKVLPEYREWDIWCNCIREKSDQYIGTVPMVGYGSATYILTLFKYYGY